MSLGDMDDIELLAGSELFSAFDASTLRTLVAAARPLECDRNDVVFSEDDEADELFVVRSGRVAVGRRSTDGRESLVALMEAGDLFGEMALFDERAVARPRPGPWNVRKCSASPTTSSGPFSTTSRYCCGKSSVSWPSDCATLTPALADAMFLDVTGRTAKRLLALAGAWSDDEFQLPITQEELAGLVGASRERINKSIAAFIRLGWIGSVRPAVPASWNETGCDPGSGPRSAGQARRRTSSNGQRAGCQSGLGREGTLPNGQG